MIIKEYIFNKILGVYVITTINNFLDVMWKNNITMIIKISYQALNENASVVFVSLPLST